MAAPYGKTVALGSSTVSGCTCSVFLCADGKLLVKFTGMRVHEMTQRMTIEYLATPRELSARLAGFCFHSPFIVTLDPRLIGKIKDLEFLDLPLVLWSEAECQELAHALLG